MNKKLLFLALATSFQIGAVKANEKEDLSTLLSIQQAQHQVKGVVIESTTGEPAIGAPVQIKGTTRGVVTDIDGNLSIEAQHIDVLAVCYIGFVTGEI